MGKDGVSEAEGREGVDGWVGGMVVLMEEEGARLPSTGKSSNSSSSSNAAVGFCASFVSVGTAGLSCVLAAAAAEAEDDEDIGWRRCISLPTCLGGGTSDSESRGEGSTRSIRKL
jgi:hypothetical protein